MQLRNVTKYTATAPAADLELWTLGTDPTSFWCPSSPSPVRHLNGSSWPCYCTFVLCRACPQRRIVGLQRRGLVSRPRLPRWSHSSPIPSTHGCPHVAGWAALPGLIAHLPAACSTWMGVDGALRPISTSGLAERAHLSSLAVTDRPVRCRRTGSSHSPNAPGGLLRRRV